MPCGQLILMIDGSVVNSAKIFKRISLSNYDQSKINWWKLIFGPITITDDKN